MRRLALLTLPALLAACSLISPYQVTFTTQDGAVLDPATDTLDFVVSAPALAYISAVDCDEAEDLELLPVVTDDMEAKTAYNLSIAMLNGKPGSECDITVSVFDQSTTATASEEISVVVAGEESTEETAEETVEEATEETMDDETVSDETSSVEENTETDASTEDSTQVEVEVQTETQGE